MGHSMVRPQEGCVVYLYTKFEAASLIRLKVIRVPKIQHWVTSPRQANLGFGLCSLGRTVSSSICVPNSRRIFCSFVTAITYKLGSQNFEIGSRDHKPRPILNHKRDNRLRGLRVARGSNFSFLINLRRRPNNTLTLPCKCVISVSFLFILLFSAFFFCQ